MHVDLLRVDIATSSDFSRLQRWRDQLPGVWSRYSVPQPCSLFPPASSLRRLPNAASSPFFTLLLRLGFQRAACETLHRRIRPDPRQQNTPDTFVP